MSDEAKIKEYRDAILNITVCMNMLSGYDLPGILKAIEYADSVGPVFDPTLWRDKNKLMREDMEMVKAAMPLWRLQEELRAKQQR